MTIRIIQKSLTKSQGPQKRCRLCDLQRKRPIKFRRRRRFRGFENQDLFARNGRRQRNRHGQRHLRTTLPHRRNVLQRHDDALFF